jgi:cell division protein FtsB
MSFDPSGETGSDGFFLRIRERALEKRIEELEAENARLEENIELLWRETDGILPSTGRMWLTPRMEREAINDLC